MGGGARHSVRAAIDIQPPELSAAVAIQTLAEHLKLETFKKLIMQVTVCKSVTLAAKAPKMPGSVAIGFPLPSTGPQRGEGLRVRGGHIQSRLPSVASCISPI